jgi:hypothetical protein
MKYLRYLPLAIIVFGYSLAMRLIAFIFKAMHWPDAQMLEMISVTGIIASLFAILGLSNKTGLGPVLSKPFNVLPQPFKIMLTMGGVIALLGVLFRIQHWVGSAQMIIIGFGTLAVVLIITARLLAEKIRRIIMKK